MKVIGLLGKKGSGKGTVAAALQGIDYVELAFADPLYEEVSEAFGVPIARLKNRGTKEDIDPALKLTCCQDPKFMGIAQKWCIDDRNNLRNQGGYIISPLDGHFMLSPRRVLQLWGTEYRRADDNFYWVKKLDARLKLLKQEGCDAVVISDVREAMEAAYVKRRDNGVVWKLVRADNPYEDHGTASHSSETEVDKIAFDTLVNNNGSIEDLKHLALELEAIYAHSIK